MYIAYHKETKQVVDKRKKPFITIPYNVAIAECDNIPQIYDYLLVDNIRQETRVIKEAYTEEIIEFNEETHQEETKLIEHPQVTETYYACDLIAKFREYTVEQLEQQKQDMYGNLTTKYFRQKYDENKVEAVQNNYLLFLSGKSPERLDFIEEHDKMQEYRQECKAKAHLEVYGY